MPAVITIILNASDTTTYALGENYQWRITWISEGALQYIHTVYFDVVLETVNIDVGLSDLVLEVADMEERLTRQAAASDTANVRAEPVWRQEVRRGWTTNGLQFWPKAPDVGWTGVNGTPTYTIHKPDGTQIASGNCTVTTITGTYGRTASTLAAQYVIQAWLDTSALIQAQCEAKGWTRPKLIIDSEKIRRVMAAFAVSRAYRAEGGAVDSESRLLAEDWRTEAESRFRALGPLRYDATEDRVADQTLGGWSVASMRRAW